MADPESQARESRCRRLIVLRCHRASIVGRQKHLAPPRTERRWGDGILAGVAGVGLQRGGQPRGQDALQEPAWAAHLGHPGPVQASRNHQLGVAEA